MIKGENTQHAPAGEAGPAITAASIPFDRLVVGQSARIERRLTRDDLTAFAHQAAAGDPDHMAAAFATHELFHDFIAHAMWGHTLLATAVLAEMPGPGTRLLAENIEYRAPAAIGDVLMVTLTVADKPADRQVLLECRCEKSSGELVARGTLLVRAPTEAATVSEEDLDQPRPASRRPHFQRLLNRARELQPATTAVVHPVDELSMRGAMVAAQQGLIVPVLIGPKQRIDAAAKRAGLDLGHTRVIDAPHSHAAADRAVELARNGEVDALMKGALHTEEIMGAILRCAPMRTERRVSHVWAIDVPTYPRLLLLTDAAINVAPDLRAKRDIVQNALDLAAALNIEKPKVAILAATEEVNPDMSATMDAAALCKMAERRQITGGVLDGPLAFDNAVSEQAAKTKHIVSPVAGRADILVAPDIEAGNMLGKQLSYLADAEAAGIVLGARLPVILTSRADGVHARVVSAALGLLMAERRRRLGGEA